MKIGRHGVGGGRCFVVAEVAQAHDGSLGTAHAYIDAAARAGADAVKMQTHIAAAESTPAEAFRIAFSRQDATRYDYWKRMELSPEQWEGLARHAEEANVVFLSSAFSPQAVELLERIGMAAWKVGSGEVTNLPLVGQMARTGKPVILSSGLSSWSDLDAAVAAVRGAGAEVAVLQCTTSYPCPPEQIGLNVIAQLRARYDCPVGLSDHSSTIFAGLAAAALGADLLEVHVVLSRECFGPDVSSSVTTAELRQLVDGVRFIERALASPVDKDGAAAQRAELRRVFGKSVVAARALAAGEVVAAEDLALKKPGTGLGPERLAGLIGRRLRRAVPADVLLCDEDFE